MIPFPAIKTIVSIFHIHSQANTGVFFLRAGERFDASAAPAQLATADRAPAPSLYVTQHTCGLAEIDTSPLIEHRLCSLKIN